MESKNQKAVSKKKSKPQPKKSAQKPDESIGLPEVDFKKFLGCGG